MPTQDSRGVTEVTVGYSGEWAIVKRQHGTVAVYFGRNLNGGRETRLAETYSGALAFVHAEQAPSVEAPESFEAPYDVPGAGFEES